MNSRVIVLAIVMAAVVAVLAFAVLRMGVLDSGSTTTYQTTTIANAISTNTTTQSTTIITTSALPTIPTSTVQSYQGCIAGASTVPIFNGDFGTGNFSGWNVTGTGFGSAPLNITYEDSNAVHGYYSNPWSGYSGTYFASTYQGGLLVSPGNITSQVFEVTEPYINFQIESPQTNNIYVEVLRNGKAAIRTYYDTVGQNGNNYSIFMNASLPVASLLCSNVSIRVVTDVVSTPATRYDFMGIGGFYLSRSVLQTPGILVNQSFLNAG